MSPPAATVYFEALAAAYLRGQIPSLDFPDRLRDAPLDELSQEELEEIVLRGRSQEIRIHRFKRTMGLERVRRSLGILRGLHPSNLLDVASGRGAFLWPLLTEFPELEVTAIERDPIHLAYFAAVARGGWSGLRAAQADAAALPFTSRSFEVVTLLEILEHLPDPQGALNEAVRVASRFVLLSVPSQPDDNPEHIHLFSPRDLTEMLERAGAGPPSFLPVRGHHLALASTGER